MWKIPGLPVKGGPGISPLSLLRVTGLVALVLVVGVAVGAFASDDPPHLLIEQTRVALSKAREANAAELAADEMATAQAAWDSMLVVLRTEGEGVPFFRRFDSVEASARFAEGAALHALDTARRRADSLQQASQSDIQIVREMLVELTRAAEFYPPGMINRSALASARTMVSLSESARDRSDHSAAARFAGSARTELHGVQARVYAISDSIAMEAAYWQAQVAELSRRRSYPFLVVDKAARRLTFHQSGTRIDTFSVELGPAWLGDKAVEGDRRTPEGLYRVTRKLAGAQTRYHRALLLDYPNTADKERFRLAKRQGHLHPDARIGGLIEIHGGGGREGDWTDGCVALTNSDMQSVFDRVPNNTLVLIAPAL